jgi:hypothetical protein
VSWRHGTSIYTLAMSITYWGYVIIIGGAEIVRASYKSAFSPSLPINVLVKRCEMLVNAAPCS